MKMKNIFSKKPKVRDKNGRRTLQLVSANAPFQYVEAYKTLRTNLNFVTLNSKNRVIVITSSIPSEGKSNVGINLAVTLAEAGKKVLIIDCDLRKPVLHKYLRITRRALGLTNILSGEVEPNEAIVYFNDLDFDVITAGVVPPNPAELLGSERMEKLLKKLREQYDYILLDTPPASVVTDAAVLGSMADGVIMVIKHKGVNVETAQLAKRNLETAKVNILGAVLTNYDLKNTAKDSGYSYSYEYNYYK